LSITYVGGASVAGTVTNGYAAGTGFNVFQGTSNSGALLIFNAFTNGDSSISISTNTNTFKLFSTNITEAKLLLADNTTANASASAHGFLPKVTTTTNGVPINSGTAAVWGAISNLLSAGANITITSTNGIVTITSTDTGEVNTVSNLGTSNGTVKPIFTTKSGVNFPLRAIEAGTGISLGITTTSIVVNASGGGALTGNSVWVDKVNGNDGTGARGSLSTPFLTLGAASAAASAGDTVFVLPGNWDENSIQKNGVNWHFFNGASISNSSNSLHIWEDTTLTDTYRITGDGVFDGYVLYCGGSTVTMNFKRISGSKAGGDINIDGGDSGLDWGRYRLDGSANDCLEARLATLTVRRAKISNSTTQVFLIDPCALTLIDCVMVSAGTYAIEASGAANVRNYGTLMSNKTNHNVTFITGNARFEVDTDVQ